MQPNKKGKHKSYHHDHEEHGEQHLAHDESNWLVSYADMMTLLFGFFVLMYSFSRVDQEKFAVVQKDLVKYFGGKMVDKPGSPERPLQLRKDLEVALKTTLLEGNTSKGTDNRVEANGGDGGDSGNAQDSNATNIDKSNPASTAAAGDPSDTTLSQDDFSITSSDDKLFIRFNSDVFFKPGSTTPEPKSIAAVTSVFKSIQKYPIREIEVQGHTDSDPIHSAVFPSNWELSSARASAVVRILEGLNFPKDRLKATGFAASRPLEKEKASDQNLVEIKKKNRRVLFEISLDKNAPKIEEVIKNAGSNVVTNFNPQKPPLPDPSLQNDLANPKKDDLTLDLEKKYEESKKRIEEANLKLKAIKEQEKKAKEIENMLIKAQQMEQKAKEAERNLKELELKKIDPQTPTALPKQSDENEFSQ